MILNTAFNIVLEAEAIPGAQGQSFGEQLMETKSFVVLGTGQDHVYVLYDKDSDAAYPFRFIPPLVHEEQDGSQVRSSWTGEIRDFCAELLPKVERIRNLLQPLAEDFYSESDCTEFEYGTDTYSCQYQSTVYKCVLANQHLLPGQSDYDPELKLTLNFKNIVFTGATAFTLSDGKETRNSFLSHFFHLYFKDLLEG